MGPISFEDIMTDLIIGAAHNYDFDTIKPWISSINRTGFAGDIVLIIYGATNDLVNDVGRMGVRVLTPAYQSDIAVHVQRFAHISDFLRNNTYDWVITTDVRDVVFQYDPMVWIEAHMSSYKKLLAGSECLSYKDEPWGDNNLLETFGPYVYNLLRNKTIYNVGVLSGRSDYMRDLCLDLAIHSLGRPIKICDQAVFNYLINSKPYQDVFYLADMRDGWSTNLGTVADPRKMHYFTPNLLEQPPVMTNGSLTTTDGKQFAVVHQYDRTVWKDEILRKYG